MSSIQIVLVDGGGGAIAIRCADLREAALQGPSPFLPVAAGISLAEVANSPLRRKGGRPGEQHPRPAAWFSVPRFLLHAIENFPTSLTRSHGEGAGSAGQAVFLAEVEDGGRIPVTAARRLRRLLGDMQAGAVPTPISQSEEGWQWLVEIPWGQLLEVPETVVWADTPRGREALRIPGGNLAESRDVQNALLALALLLADIRPSSAPGQPDYYALIGDERSSGFRTETAFPTLAAFLQTFFGDPVKALGARKQKEGQHAYVPAMSWDELIINGRWAGLPLSAVRGSGANGAGRDLTAEAMAAAEDFRADFDVSHDPADPAVEPKAPRVIRIGFYGLDEIQRVRTRRNVPLFAVYPGLKSGRTKQSVFYVLGKGMAADTTGALLSWLSHSTEV